MKCPVLKNKKGFTMVELMVTLVIGVILAGVVTLSLIAYNEYANFKRQNEYAESLFVAAQNALTHYSENGELESIAKTMDRYGKVLSKEMLKGEANEKFKNEYKNRIYYITVNKDGTVYGESGSSAKSEAIKGVFEKLLEPYVYDKTILNDASVTIEFDPQSGVVYSVLYSDIKTGFLYGDDKDDYVSISDRDYDVRKARMVGFYGIEDLSDVTSRTKEKPVIETVKLVNDKALSLEFKLTDKYAAAATSALTYDIEVYNGESRKLLMSFSFKAPKSATSLDGAAVKYKDLTFSTKVKTYDPETGTQKAEKEYEFIGYVDDKLTVHLMLDNVDLAALPNAAEEVMAKTYSFHRFGTDALLGEDYTSNIYVNVRGQGGRYKTTAWKRSNTENAYFASQSLKTGAFGISEYTIENARHLYNVRFEEQKENKNITSVTYKAAKTFSWGGEDGMFYGDLGSFVFSSGAEIGEINGAGQATAFPSIEALKAGHTFTSSSTKVSINNLVLSGNAASLGLFDKNYGSINNVTIGNAAVSGGASVGTFCGINYGTLENLTTVGGTVKGTENVGGIFGRDEVKADHTYSGLNNNSDVSGSKYIGGITGKLVTEKNQSITVENCNNTGFIYASLGSSTDLTGQINDGAVDSIHQFDPSQITMGATNKNLVGNMYKVFLETFGEYPLMNEYDKNVLEQLWQQDNINKLDGITTMEQAVESFCGKYRWYPCAVKDPDGSILDKSGDTYSIILVAKNGDGKEGANTSPLIYYNGTYYYHVNEWQYDNWSGQKNISDGGQYCNNTVTKLSDIVNNTNPYWFSFSPTIAGGKVEPVNGATTFKNEPCYIGGIVGMSNADEIGSRVDITDCSNNSDTDDEKIRELLENNAAFYSGEDEVPLLGVYAGGIAGYTNYTYINNCSSNGGYVVGSHYVGGIVGLSQNTNITDGTSNSTNVIGNYYAGGILGVNADVSGKDANSFITVSKSYTNATAQNCNNSGVVIAAKEYGGGITGFNAGQIKECSSRISSTEFTEEIAKKYGGDYIGGITGYNLGDISSDSGIKVTSFVAGRNYVGGIIGYNADSSHTTVYGYSYDGGYVSGNNFVGGFAGFNTSPMLFTDKNGSSLEIKANPNAITGNNFVGGVIGGNIIAPNGNITAVFNTNNFLGEIESTGFSGGFIGLNLFSNNIEPESLAKEFAEYDDDYSSTASKLNARCKAISSDYSFTISGIEKGSVNKFSGITAKIYAGGVMGYNGVNTNVTIENVVNKSPIYTTAYVTVDELEGEENLDPYNSNAQKRYSYAGGIVGKCTENMTITGCSGEDTGIVVSSGTYNGGLVEVNEGKIINCSAANIGNTTMNYVGGIVGLNKKSGVITAPSLNGKTITGANMVGGITSDNYGTVKGDGLSVDGNVIGYGENIGGIAGLSHSGAAISGFVLNVNVSGSGENVGGAAGKNIGAFSNVTYNKSGNTIDGKNNVGGIIGLQVTDTGISYVNALTNYADVTSQYGYAGGIIGYVKDGTGDSFSLMNCKNMGQVRSLGEKAGYETGVGGIVGRTEKKTAVNGCSNTGNVSVGKGAVGGIAGHAGYNITGCKVYGSAEIYGDKAVGGIAGICDGGILSCNIKDVKIYNYSYSSGGSLGGIVAENTLACIGNNVENLSIKSYASPVNIGGIAGVNNGTIGSGTANSYVKNSTMEFAAFNLNYFGNIGGIAGVNNGEIKKYDFIGSYIYGTANDPSNAPQYNPNYDYEPNGSVVYGYGGIVGVNSNETSKVEDCSVNGANIRVIGDPNNIANVGGAAGVNNKNAVINGFNYGSTLSTIISTTSKDSVEVPDGTELAYAHIGGAVGYNYGTVTNVGKKRAKNFGDGSTAVSEQARRDSMDTVSLVNVYASQGHIGGIVGYNKSTGKLTDCATGALWHIKNSRQAQDNGTGGIIGYNSSAADITRCDNWAEVSKTVANSTATGGIVGRQEVTLNASWQMNNCNNFGTVKGIVSGGVVGRMKYRGGTFYRCSNYGDVINVSPNAEDTGGVIANMYAIMKDDYVYITECSNYGAINAQAARAVGGIVGAINENAGGSRVVISNCVNTGIISGGAQRGGIIGMSKANTGVDSLALVVQSCRNYYTGASNDTNFCGIANDISKPGLTLLQNNIGVSDSYYPISKKTNFKSGSADNYFFTENQISVDSVISSVECVVGNKPGTWQERKNRFVNGIIDIENAYVQAVKNESQFVLTFDRLTEISSIELWPYFKDETVKRKFLIEYSQSDSGDGWQTFNDDYENKWLYSSDMNHTNGVLGDDKGIQLDGSTVSVKRVKITVYSTGSTENIAIREIGFNNQVKNWMQPSSSSDDERDYGYGEPLNLKNTGDTIYDAYRSGVAAPAMTALNFGVAYNKYLTNTSKELYVTGSGSNNLRQNAYLLLEPKLNPQGGGSLPSDPSITSVTDVGGAFEVMWDCDNAYSYVVRAEFSDGTAFETTMYDKRCEIPTIGKNGLTAVITVQSRSVTGVLSEGKSERTVTVSENILPTPSIKFVLTDVNDTNYYKIIVENAEEYVGMGGVTVKVTTNAGINSQITVDNNGIYTPAYVKGKGGNINYIITAQASSENQSYGLSAKSSRETTIPNSDNYKTGEAMGYVTNNPKDAKNNLDLGFVGDTPETLSYAVGIKANKYSMFYRANLMATEVNGLGVPVVYSAGTMRASTTYTNDKTNNYARMLLANLPSDITDDAKYKNVSVMVYPISASNEIVFTGIDLKTGLSASELLSIKVTDKGEISDSGTSLISESANGRTVKDGYVITKIAEDNYTLSYNALVKAYLSGVGSTQVTNFTDVKGNTQTEPDPVINVTYSDAADSYVASFDCDENGNPATAGARYTYKLTGITKDGSQTLIDSSDDVVAANGTNLLTYDTSGWGFTSVTLTVQRKGMLASGTSITQTFGTSSSKTTATKLKLPKISAPNAKLVNKDYVEYNVSWSGISQTSEEYAYVDSYNLMVNATVQTADGPKDITATYNTRTSDSSNPLATTLKVDLNNISGVDASGKKYTGYVAGEAIVKMWVNAVAKTDQSVYYNSPKGVEYSLTMQTRLETPLTSYLTPTTFDSGTAISVEEFENTGFTLKYSGDDRNKDVNGYYEMTVDIVDTDGETLIKTLYSAKTPMQMNGNVLGEEATAVLNKTNGLTADYAGKKLRVSVRAVASDRISSLWSKTTTRQLPMVIVNSVDIGSAHKLAEINANIYENDSNTPEATTVEVKQDSFTWSQERFTAGYELMLTRTEKPQDLNKYPSYVDFLKISFDNGVGYKAEPIVKFIDSKAVIEGGGNPTTSQGTVLSSVIQKDVNSKTYTYDIYDRKIPIINENSEQINGLNVQLKGTLEIKMVSDGKGGVSSVTYKLILPDSKLPVFNEVSGSVAQDALFIKTVSVTAIAKGVSYENSKVSVSERDANNNFNAVSSLTKSGIAYSKQLSVLEILKGIIAKSDLTVSDPIIVVRIPQPTVEPTAAPTAEPTAEPTQTAEPTAEPTGTPEPTAEPTDKPTATPEPTTEPTTEPTVEPTAEPTEEPTATPEPTAEPTPDPTPEATQELEIGSEQGAE